jgi:hypothetical protein
VRLVFFLHGPKTTKSAIEIPESEKRKKRAYQNEGHTLLISRFHVKEISILLSAAPKHSTDTSSAFNFSNVSVQYSLKQIRSLQMFPLFLTTYSCALKLFAKFVHLKYLDAEVFQLLS